MPRIIVAEVLMESVESMVYQLEDILRFSESLNVTGGFQWLLFISNMPLLKTFVDIIFYLRKYSR